MKQLEEIKRKEKTTENKIETKQKEIRKRKVIQI